MTINVAVNVHDAQQHQIMSREESITQRRKRLLGPAYRLFYDEPLHIVRGEGCWLTDAQGRRYLDAYNNVPHVGHAHPRVVEAICRQSGVLNTHTRYLHENVLELSERLTGRLPDGAWHAMYACSGTEANDLALRIARTVTGNQGVIVTEHAYHGHSIAIAPLSTDSTPPERRGNHVVTIPAPETFRCPVSPASARDYYLAQLDKALATLAARGHQPAALLLDTVLSSEGMPTVPGGFLGAAAERIRAAGGLFIADEVQAGFGRTGTHFFGFDRLGGVPDLVTLGKPMGNGHPISAVLLRAGLAEQFSEVSHYFNTFAGNPVSCAAALAVLDVLEEEHLQENARRQGEGLVRELKTMARRFEVMGDVRGSGLFIGIDLVEAGQDKRPDAALAQRVMNRMRNEGVLIGVTGQGENVLKIRPPLVFGDKERALLLETLERVLSRELEG